MPRYPMRADGLGLFPVPEGYVVHQAAKGRVHRLNASAALVLELSQGRQTIEDLAVLVQRAFGLDAVPLKEVRTSVRALAAQGLLTLPPRPVTPAAARTAAPKRRPSTRKPTRARTARRTSGAAKKRARPRRR